MQATSTSTDLKRTVAFWLSESSDSLFQIYDWTKNQLEMPDEKENALALRLMHAVAEVLGEDFGAWEMDWESEVKERGLEIDPEKLDPDLLTILTETFGVNPDVSFNEEGSDLRLGHLEKCSEITKVKPPKFPKTDSSLFKAIDAEKAFRRDYMFTR